MKNHKLYILFLSFCLIFTACAGFNDVSETGSITINVNNSRTGAHSINPEIFDYLTFEISLDGGYKDSSNINQMGANGGGVHLLSNATNSQFSMNGNSKIEGCSASCGGGVLIDNGIFMMTGNACITGNTAYQGSGVYNSKTFRIGEGAYIADENNVYLDLDYDTSNQTSITIISHLTKEHVAKIETSECFDGGSFISGRDIKVLTAGDGVTLANEYQKFTSAPDKMNEDYIDTQIDENGYLKY